MIHALEGPVMPYAWGSRSELAALLGREPSGRAEAELWLGAHPAGPARLLHPVGPALNLSALLAADLPNLLGSELAGRFDGLPFLLKVLAIEEPLSLQAHPDAEQARRGFEQEEALGLALSDPKRNYKDSRHKPELLLALSPVEALCGLRPRGEVAALLAAFGLAESGSPLEEPSATFLGQGDMADYEQLFRSLFALSPVALETAIERVLRAARAGAPREVDPADFSWVSRMVERLERAFGPDPGLLGALLLQPVRLSPGQAVFLPARRLHAYLSGIGIEVMAESDNVLRGGLTPKHVDIDELCRVLDFRPSQPDLVTPHVSHEGRVHVYRGAALEFELWRIELAAGAPAVEVPSPALLLVLDGEVDVTQGAVTERFGRGGQAFVSFSAATTSLSGVGRVVLGAVPQANA